MKSMRRPFVFSPSLALALVVWLAAIGVGFTMLWRHAYTPGPAAEASPAWPAEIPRDSSRPTLVMVLHPQCECSEASVNELARVIARSPVPINTLIYFDVIGDETSASDGRLWNAAAALPGVTLVADRDGVKTRRFGAFVSGQTFLFDRAGHLIFSGGLTAARAHAGDNDGETAVLAALRDGISPIATTPVFGCLLNERTSS